MGILDVPAECRGERTEELLAELCLVVRRTCGLAPAAVKAVDETENRVGCGHSPVRSRFEKVDMLRNVVETTRVCQEETPISCSDLSARARLLHLHLFVCQSILPLHLGLHSFFYTSGGEMCHEIVRGSSSVGARPRILAD